MTQRRPVEMNSIMQDLDARARRELHPDALNAAREVSKDMYSALNLGKYNIMTDPMMCKPHPLLMVHRLKETDDIRQNGGKGAKVVSRALCAMHGYGRDAMWPSMDPGKSHLEQKTALETHASKMEQAWLEFRHVVIGSERLIQDAVVKLAEITEGPAETSALEPLLKAAWTEARDHYNEAFVDPPEHIARDYYLDPKGAIADGHSSDLEIFALDFLKDMTESSTWGISRHYPLYRHGANYRDRSETLANIMRLGPATFDQLTEPAMQPGNPIAFNKNVREYLRKVRANFLVPHINLADLLDPRNLLSFIHYRARQVPSEFAPIDKELTYLGRHSMILSGSFDCVVLVSFKVPATSDDETEGEGPLRFWHRDGEYSDIEELDLSGQVFGTMEASVILQSQAITYMFLGKLCEAVLQIARKEARKEAPGSPTKTAPGQGEEVDALQRLKELRGDETWRDIASMSQYEPLPEKINLDRYRGSILAKRERAEEHIDRLFNEPEYFFEQLLEQKEHHWVNLDLGHEGDQDRHMEEYHEGKPRRHGLYEDCLRSVLRRAVFEFFMWRRVEETLTLLRDQDDNRHPYGKDNDGMKPSTHHDGAKTWPSLKWSTYDLVQQDEHPRMKYITAQTLIRYFGAFFVYEFRNKAIHAASRPMRDIYCITQQPGQVGQLERRHYGSDMTQLGLKKRTLAQDRQNLTRIVAELIEHFISHSTSSMYVGMRKVTARLQQYLDDCDDEETAAVFSPLVSDTIDSLDLLAELAEHLELHAPTHEDIMIADESKRREWLGSELNQASIDILAFDDFQFQGKVPDKRIKRIYQFLDEMQGFGKAKINMGQARGDLKRLGSCLLHKYIHPTNEEEKCKASQERLNDLESKMGVARNQYPYKHGENPMDLDKQEGKPNRKPTAEWRDTFKRLVKEAKERREELKEARRRTFFGNTNDPVADELKRREMLEVRTKNEQKPPSPAQDLAAGVQELGIQPQPPAQRPLPQPGQPLPAPRQPGQQQPQLPLPPPPGPRPLPLQPRPLTVPPPTVSLAPDGNPPGRLRKRVWGTFRSLFDQDQSAVSWQELVQAMNAIGYKDEGRGGSHGVFSWTDSCRWPLAPNGLPKSKNIQLSKYHGGGRTAAPRAKVKDWGVRLEQRGLTWGVFKQWYRQQM